MAVEDHILKALSTHLKTFTGIPMSQVKFPGVQFDQPNTGQWVEVRFFPAEPDSPWLSNDDPADYRGIYQVTACGHQGDGMPAIVELASAIAEHFPKGARLVDDGVAVRLEQRSGVSAALEEDTVIRVPVAVRYRCQA